MDSPVVGGLLAFVGGAAIAYLNYRLNLWMLRKNPSALANVTVLRQLLNVGYLAAVFFLSRVLPWDHIPLLVGAAVGLTVPAFLLALRLSKINASLSSKKDDPTGKGADPNG